MLNHNGTGTGNGNLDDWRTDLCGCHDLECADCREDAAREGAMDEASAVDGETSAPTTPVVSEADAIDNQFGWPTTPAACKPYLPSTLAFAHMEIVSLDAAVTTLRKHIAERDQIIGRKVAYLTQLELAFNDAEKRIENLTITTRELEAMIIKRDEEIATKRAAVIYESNQKLDAFSRANSLQMSIYALEDRIAGHEADMKGTLARVAELESSLVMMTEIADVAAKDADKYLNDGAELSDLLRDSGKREDRAHETLMGIRALAESDMLTDAEKVALILRLA